MTKKHTMRSPGLTALVGVLAVVMAGPALAQAPPEAPPAAGMAFEQDDRAEGRGWGRGRRGPGGPEMGRGWMHPAGPRAQGLRMALRHLDLSDSQRAEIRAIFESERDQMRAHHEHMTGLSAELRDQIATDPADEDAVRVKASEIARVGVEIAVLRARQAGQVRSVLTPVQREELEKMREQRRGGPRTEPRG